MINYRWSVHDKDGHCIHSGESVIEAIDENGSILKPKRNNIVNVVKKIQEVNNIDFSHYDEFRIKQI